MRTLTSESNAARGRTMTGVLPKLMLVNECIALAMGTQLADEQWNFQENDFDGGSEGNNLRTLLESLSAPKNPPERRLFERIREYVLQSTWNNKLNLSVYLDELFVTRQKVAQGELSVDEVNGYIAQLGSLECLKEFAFTTLSVLYRYSDADGPQRSLLSLDKNLEALSRWQVFTRLFNVPDALRDRFNNFMAGEGVFENVRSIIEGLHDFERRFRAAGAILKNPNDNQCKLSNIHRMGWDRHLIKTHGFANIDLTIAYTSTCPISTTRRRLMDFANKVGDSKLSYFLDCRDDRRCDDEIWMGGGFLYDTYHHELNYMPSNIYCQRPESCPALDLALNEPRVYHKLIQTMIDSETPLPIYGALNSLYRNLDPASDRAAHYRISTSLHFLRLATSKLMQSEWRFIESIVKDWQKSPNDLRESIIQAYDEPDSPAAQELPITVSGTHDLDFVVRFDLRCIFLAYLGQYMAANPDANTCKDVLKGFKRMWHNVSDQFSREFAKRAGEILLDAHESELAEILKRPVSMSDLFQENIGRVITETLSEKEGAASNDQNLGEGIAQEIIKQLVYAIDNDDSATRLRKVRTILIDKFREAPRSVRLDTLDMLAHSITEYCTAGDDNSPEPIIVSGSFKIF